MCLREYFLQLFHSISLQLKLQVYSISENKVICVKYVVFYFKIIFFSLELLFCALQSYHL